MINRLARLKLHIKFQQSPVISISDTTGPLNEVFFPSVTVCNLNQVWLNADESLFFIKTFADSHVPSLQVGLQRHDKGLARRSDVHREISRRRCRCFQPEKLHTGVLGQNSNEKKLKSENKHFHHIASF